MMAICGSAFPASEMTIEDIQETLDAYGTGRRVMDMARVAELTAELSRRLFRTTAPTESRLTIDEVEAELLSPPIGPRFVMLDKPAGEVVFVNVDEVVLVESFVDSDRFCYVWVRCDNRPLVVKGDPARVHAEIHAAIKS